MKGAHAVEKGVFSDSGQGRFSETLTDFRAKTGVGTLFTPRALSEKAIFAVHTDENN